ncbi:MerR family transcriptional regulator [Pseudomonas panipatensis]|uniref:MerR family transcriptional regulator n=1 Tax=Pseudomonas panipatensis TaxID=428992 RepID=UPI0035AE4504
MTELTDSAVPVASSEELLPIREVVRQTGVNPVTLRAWERRYGLIRPVRTDGGHRLYSRRDIDAIQRILVWTSRGVAVGKVGELLAQQQNSVSPASRAEDPDTRDHEQWREAFRQAVVRFDSAELERLYGQLFTLYPASVVFDGVLLPLWRTLLQRNEFGASSQWLFLDSFLRARLLLRLQMGRSGNRERILLAALPGVCRELELLCVGLQLAGDGMAVEVLAPGQPLEELPLVCEAARPAALVLFAPAPLSPEQVRRLVRLQLGLGCPLALAGEAAEVGAEGLSATPIACLGSSGQLMQWRLRKFIDGHLDT